jgi:hypothetical protein
MTILINIKYKKDGNAKLHAVKTYKEITGVTLIEAKKFVEDAIVDESITYLDDELARLIGSKVFDCEMVVIDEPKFEELKIDDETKEALEWYENQLPFIQARIDLIVNFRQQEMIPRG